MEFTSISNPETEELLSALFPQLTPININPIKYFENIVLQSRLETKIPNKTVRYKIKNKI